VAQVALAAVAPRRSVACRARHRCARSRGREERRHVR
jgi:hypothetical protein